MSRRIRKVAVISFATLLSTIFLLLAAISLYDSPEYTRRLLVYGQSDINDYLIFPERKIESGERVSTIASHTEKLPEMVSWLLPDGERHTARLQEVIVRTGTRALIVVQNDTIIHEGYYNGATRDTINTSFSSAKSFNSALIGAALADGLINSVDDPVIKYLPELAARGYDSLTLRDLLRMSTGIRYVERGGPLAPFGDDALTYYSPDLRRTALRARASDVPVGSAWHYNNFHPLLEGLILERVTGMSVAQYLQERFWKPMGAEFPASWSLDSTASGFEKMESGINARAVDYARFGLIFLHDGVWNGAQILPEAWVRESTSPENGWRLPSTGEEPVGYYAYHWWGLENPDGTYDFTAAGRYGQYVYVAPRKNAVVVRLGGENQAYPVDWMLLLHDLVGQLP
jgi:CubicO group peptidase (beta-lactamase class C family)